MIKYIIPFLTIFASMAMSCVNNANESCIGIMMTDLYGDGWDGARLYAEFPDGATGSDAPTCTEKTIYREICTDASGMFYLTNAIEEPRIPENYWEILWTVEVCGNETNSTMLYTGTYNTTMIFSYDSSNLQWSLVYYENVLPNEKECDACGDAQKCTDDDDKRPRPKRRRSPKKDDDKSSPKKDDDKSSPKKDDDKISPKKDDDKSSKKDDDRRLRAGDNNIRGPRKADTRVTMFDEEGDGWWKNNYLGNSWYLADSSRTMLYHSGTLCDGESGYCNMCLMDGEYTIRFTGNGSNGFTTWDFCGVTGTYGQELIFEVENGYCVPIAILDVERACGNVTITYTFESSLELCLMSEYLNLTDSAAVSTITQTLVDVMGADSASILMDDEEDDKISGLRRRHRRSGKDDDKKKKKRRSRSRGKDDDKKKKKSGSDDKDEDDMKIYKHEIDFIITFTIQSDRLPNHNWLEEMYEEMLNAKIANGTFISTLKANSLLYGYNALNWTSCAESDDFDLISLIFVDSIPFEESSLPLTDVTNHNIHEISSYDYSSITLFFGALLLGFVAFVGILARGFNGYDNLSNDSEHFDEFIDGSSSSSVHSRHGLISNIEMDHTISNPLGRNAAHEADVKRVSSTL